PHVTLPLQTHVVYAQGGKGACRISRPSVCPCPADDCRRRFPACSHLRGAAHEPAAVQIPDEHSKLSTHGAASTTASRTHPRNRQQGDATLRIGFPPVRPAPRWWRPIARHTVSCRPLLEGLQCVALGLPRSTGWATGGGSCQDPSSTTPRSPGPGRSPR